MVQIWDFRVFYEKVVISITHKFILSSIQLFTKILISHLNSIITWNSCFFTYNLPFFFFLRNYQFIIESSPSILTTKIRHNFTILSTLTTTLMLCLKIKHLKYQKIYFKKEKKNDWISVQILFLKINVQICLPPYKQSSKKKKKN